LSPVVVVGRVLRILFSMSDPLIFDPATGELISSARAANMGSEGAGRRAYSAAAAGDGGSSGSYRQPSFEDRIITNLCRGDEAARRAALAGILGDSSREWSARTVAAVLSLLSSPAGVLREEALEVARKLGFHAVVLPVAEAILRGSDVQARLAVLRLAEGYGAQGTALADVILPVLESPNAELAEAAVRAAGSVGLTPSSVSELASLIRHKESRVRRLCVRMLGLLGARGGGVSGLVVLRLDDPDGDVRHDAAAALEVVGFHSSAMDEIKRMLNHGNLERRVEMLRILGRFGSSAQESSSLLVPLLKSEEPEMRVAARKTLRVVGLSRDCFKPLEQLARHPSHDVRSAALDLLEECGSSPESCALTLSLMADRDVGLRERAAGILARNGVPAASLPALRKILRDERDPVRILALESLARAGEGGLPAVRLIIERMEDGNMDVAKAAAVAFAALGGAGDCLSDISRLLHNRRQDRRLLMLATLRGMGPTAAAALPLVTAGLGDEDWVVRDAACDAFIAIGFHDSCIPEVRRLIEHQDRNYRLAVIRALGSCGLSARAADAFLSERQGDSDAEVGRAARGALAAVRGQMV